jgi:hypothetical protein
VCEAELLIGVFEQHKPGIRRQASPIKVEGNGFVPDRRQLKWGSHIGVHRIDTSDGVCFGAIRAHVGSLLWL